MFYIVPFKVLPDIHQGVDIDKQEPGGGLLSLRAKSAGARISAHGQKSKHLANRGAFVGGGFSLCTSAAKLG